MKRIVFLAALILAVGAALPAFAQQNPPHNAMALLTQVYGLGGSPTTTEQDFTVGTTAIKIGKLDPGRISFVAINTGSSNCTVAYNPAVTTAAGTVLAAGGGLLSENFRDDLTIPTAEHWAICAASGGTIHVLTLDLM